MKILFSLFTLFTPLALFATIRLQNDTSFPLTAHILNRMGQHVGTVNLAAGEYQIWYDNQSPYATQPNFPYTPYTVSWICNLPQQKDDDESAAARAAEDFYTEYASWSNVPPGALVNAIGSPDGTKTCKIRKRPKTEEPPDYTRNRSLLPTNPNQGPGNDLTYNRYTEE